MLVSLLMPLVLAGAMPADPATVALAPAGVPAAAAVFGDPPVRIDLNERVYRPGDRAKVKVETEEDGYLLVFQVDTDGNLRVLFPLDPFDDSFVRGDRRIELDGRGNRETFIVEAREGQGWVYAAHSRLPFQIERYAAGDHWDYQRLSPNRLPESPEPEVTELVRNMARASFDYDIVPYAVAGRQVATTVVHRYGSYDCFGCGYGYDRYGSSLTIRIGAPARYYGSCWDAYWCDPYYYDPFYYRPRYVYYGPRYYYRPYYYGHYKPYRPRYYVDRDRFYPGFGAGVPYRDRRTDGVGVRLVSDNTVYGPPPRRVTSGLAETPARRQIEESPGYDLSPAPVRRGEVSPAAPGRAASPGSPEARTPDRPGNADTPTRRPAADADRPATDRRAVEPRTPAAEPRTPAAEPRTPAAQPRTPASEPSRRTAEPRSAEPRSSEPRSAEPRSAEPRSAEPRSGSSEPRSGSAEPRRRDTGPRESGVEPPREVEARPARPREERSASPDRARSDEREASPSQSPGTRSAPAAAPSRSGSTPRAQPAPSSSRSPSTARPSQPERRSSPQPSARSGGGDRSSSSGGSARSAPSRSGGSQPARSSGGGRRGG